MKHAYQRSACLIAFAIAIAAVGCRQSKESPKQPLFPVTGMLRIDGQPAAGATIKFVPTADVPPGPMPTAVVRQDGTFAVSFVDNEDGAPTGEYRLMVFWLELPPGGGLPSDRLQGRFSDPRQPVRKVNVTAGHNELEPIELRTQ